MKTEINIDKIAKFADMLNARAGESRSRGSLFLSCATECGFRAHDLPKPATVSVEVKAPDSRFGGWRELKVFTVFEDLFLIFDPRRGDGGHWYATQKFPDDIDREKLRGEEFFAKEDHGHCIDYNRQTVELTARRVTRRETNTGEIVDETQINIRTTTFKGEKDRMYSDSFSLTLRPDQVDMLIAAIGKPRPLIK